MDTLLKDVRFALRSLRRTPAFTVAAVATLALGIGANTAIFSVVDGVLLRNAPVDDIGNLVMVWETDRNTGTTHEPASLPDFLDLQQRSRTVQQFGAFGAFEANLTRPGNDPERLPALAVSHEFLPMLGIRPLAGRLLERDETLPTGPFSVVISEDLWEREFDRSQSAIGAGLVLNDVEFTVVGVVGRDAEFGILQVLNRGDYGRGFAQRGGRVQVDLWVGLRADATTSPRSTHPYFVAGRLAPGATVDAAQTEVAGIMADLEAEFPVNANRGANVEALSDVVFAPVSNALWTLLAAVALVLVIACANVANLLLVRAAARTREVTVRVALGASGRRLVQQFFVEGAAVTAVGAVLGVALAFIAVDVLKALAPVSIPRVDAVSIDLRVLAVTLATCAVVAFAFGLIPSLQARRQQLQASLQGAGGRGTSSGREQRRLRHTLIVSELAMATMLMVGAGLLIQTLWRLQNVDLGFDASGVLKAEYQLPPTRYPRNFANYPNWPETQRFNGALQGQLEALPGVTGVTIAGYHPLNAGNPSSIRVVGREAEAATWPEPTIRMVGGNYFDVMSVAVLSGRALDARDVAESQPVVVINEAARRRFFEGHEPLGQQIFLWGANRTVVGVVANERFFGAANEPGPAVYPPLAQTPSGGGSYAVMVRGATNPAGYEAPLRSAVTELDPLLPVYGVETLATTLGNSVGQQRFTMFVFGLFAAVALLLAAVGVHGVLSYTVAQRTPEIGIRVALGADPGAVWSLVLGQGARLAVLGIGLGLAGALALAQLLGSLLYGVSARDPLTFAGVAVVLSAVAMLATWLPARRAAKVDPMIALRTE